MGRAFRDANSVPTLTGVSSVDGITPTEVYVDPTTNRLYIDGSFAFSPSTSGGLSIFRSLDLDETEEEIKATLGQVYGLWFTNNASTTRWLKFYNATAANVTVGTTTPVITIGLPGNSSDNITGLFNATHGMAFATAITVAATTGVADSDVGAPAVNDVICNVFYK